MKSSPSLAWGGGLAKASARGAFASREAEGWWRGSLLHYWQYPSTVLRTVPLPIHGMERFS
jgi:hypothetical protein